MHHGMCEKTTENEKTYCGIFPYVLRGRIEAYHVIVISIIINIVAHIFIAHFFIFLLTIVLFAITALLGNLALFIANL